MNESAEKVENGVALANRSGQVIVRFLQVAEDSQRSGEEIVSAAKWMNLLTNELVGTMNGVSAVVEGNSAATEEMAAGSSEVTHAIEHINGVKQRSTVLPQNIVAKLSIQALTSIQTIGNKTISPERLR